MTAPALLTSTEPADDLPPDGAAVTDESATLPDPSGLDGGWWLTHPNGKEVRQEVLNRWKQQDTFEAMRRAKERRNELWVKGVRGAQIVASEDEDRFDVRVPFSGQNTGRAPNKATQLGKRIVATLTVDPPAPDVTPTSDEDRERDASQLAERLLTAEGSAAKRDDVQMLRKALGLTFTYGSVFVHTYWHPRRGGLEPLRIQARHDATTVDDALVMTDPATGAKTPADPASLTERYVRVDRSLTDQIGEAQLTWRGDVVEELCLPACVRLLPPTADTDTDAMGALVGRVMTLADVIAVAYDGERPDEETCKKLVAFKPDGWERWVPPTQRAALEKPTTRPDGTLTDDARVCVMWLYLASSSEAPFGVRIMISGTEEPCLREALRVTPEASDDETDAAPLQLPLPIAHLRWAEDTADGDYKGIAGIEELAAMEEIRASALRYQLEYMHNYAAPQVYLPVGSPLQEDQRSRRDGTPIRLNADGVPYFEPTPVMSPVPADLYEGMGREMDTAAGLEETAQGVASGSVKSGIHAQQIIEQALVALSGLSQNANKFTCRVWRNRLAFLRAYTDVPRQLDYLGESGDVQVRAWTGIDLVGAGDIAIARGTGTMMPRSAKVGLAREELQLAASTGDASAVTRYQKAITGNTGPLLGLQDDPIRARIARQIGRWKDEAAKQHDAAPPMLDALETSQGAMGGGNMVESPPQPPPDPVANEAAAIFAPNPTDDLPQNAVLRFGELSDVLASRAFTAADPRYQQALYVEWERMRAASGVTTLAEQQQMQAQQAQLQQQMAVEQIESKNADQAAKTAFAESEGGPAAQRMTMQNAASQIGPQPPDQP